VYANNLIQKRVKANKDLSGQKFKPYSDAYKKRRLKAGKPVDRVYLEYTGQMLAAMTHKAFTTHAQLYFATPRSETLAKYHSRDGAGKSRVIRSFFGITESEELKINKYVNTLLKNKLKFWSN